MPGQALGRKDKQEIIDLHQHTNYSGRNDERLLRHQKAMGIKWTVLLPAGRKFGLGAICGGNKTVRRVVVKNPKNYVHFANEIADHPECIETIETYWKKGPSVSVNKSSGSIVTQTHRTHRRTGAGIQCAGADAL